jgi:hypothetical protein
MYIEYKLPEDGLLRVTFGPKTKDSEHLLFKDRLAQMMLKRKDNDEDDRHVECIKSKTPLA